MFKLTFLGHQGWSVQTDDYHLLIDPIITPYFRNALYARSWIFPPRAMNPDRLAGVNGVFLTHDHEDHFHVESLNYLPRDIYMYLSGNMSGAAERILREMGFQNVRRLFALEPIAFGNQMEMTLYPPPASPTEHWVLQPFIRGRNLRESLYNPVDCTVSTELLSMLRKNKVRRLGVVALANNTQHVLSPYHPTRYMPEMRTANSNFFPAGVLNCHFGMGELPLMDCLAIVGRGFLDEANPFGIYKEQAQDQLAGILQRYSYGECSIHGAQPGDVFAMHENRMQLIPEKSDLVIRSPEAEERLAQAEKQNFDFNPLAYEYEPMTGQSTLTPAEVQRLEEHLNNFALKITCHRMGMELINTNVSKDGKTFHEARLILILKNGDSDLYYEFWPSFTEFRRIDELPVHVLDLPDHYPHGYECWASDLLGLFESDLSAYQIMLFRNRVWSPRQGMHGNYNFITVLNDLFAPECAPDITYNLYRKAYERCRIPGAV